MFGLAIFIGIYSYLLFFLGISGLLYKNIVIGLTILFWIGIVIWKKDLIPNLIRNLKKILKQVQDDNNGRNLMSLFVVVLFLQAVVNLIGVLGPELGFDALWYHLTLPKLYLQHHAVFFIPGGLLYYSAMPKLAEMLYTGVLSFGNENIVKFVHFIFGLLICLALYKLSRKFFTPLGSLIAVVIFYSNLVVAWESTSAYIDLVRTFFETMALWGFVNWIETKKQKWLLVSALMIGSAITTKVLAVGSLIIFLVLCIKYQVSGIYNKEKVLYILRNTCYFILISFIVPLPWFVFSYLHTGNPVHPFFTTMYQVNPEPINIFGFVREVWILFTQAADPISPIYMMFLPLVMWLFYKSQRKLGMTSFRMIGLYSLVAIIVWYFTPRTGGGRFILPYLPAFSIICAGVVSEVLENKKRYGNYFGKFLLILIVFVSLLSIGYRFAANKKYIPVILGKETKSTFLSSHLIFSYGDFYDSDGYFAKHIKPTDTVLLIGFHNLYYVDFPFIDSSWRRPTDTFNYIAVQNTNLPDEFSNWVLVYENDQTMVKLYKMPEHLYSLK